MPSRLWESLGLRPRDPPGSGGHYFFSNNALAGILILISHRPRDLSIRGIVIHKKGSNHILEVILQLILSNIILVISGVSSKITL